ncbi:hypothetical protein J3492_11990 [Psychrobacter sp. F1192]|uniref:Esterase n=1 Tax=Psychrobacter coccoides TaxID=2818440 RepID=A0ABS3NR89_9GAMM|nr:hypothetical protein [Psychrobacter coccoides]
MNIIYVHGLDSSANSIKGLLLERYCQHYDPDMTVHRPDLNRAPEQVFDDLVDLVTTLTGRNQDCKTVLVGSSLGGYFSTLVSNATGCSALLLNPSTQPHLTLQRFEQQGVNGQDKSDVLYTTSGGWDITRADLKWFGTHQLSTIDYPKKVTAMIKEGDELLDANRAKRFYKQQGATVIVQAGGDHRFSDFEDQLPMVIDLLQS